MCKIWTNLEGTVKHTSFAIKIMQLFLWTSPPWDLEALWYLLDTAVGERCGKVQLQQGYEGKCLRGTASKQRNCRRSGSFINTFTVKFLLCSRKIQEHTNLVCKIFCAAGSQQGFWKQKPMRKPRSHFPL